ncbi:MAG: hypothetical protein JWN03_6404 [Nocardia sp.]|nr:hypothetical protein [Nocardia sp.]
MVTQTIPPGPDRDVRFFRDGVEHGRWLVRPGLHVPTVVTEASPGQYSCLLPVEFEFEFSESDTGEPVQNGVTGDTTESVRAQ